MSVIDAGLRFSQWSGVLSHDQILEELIRQLRAKSLKGKDVAAKLGIAPARITEMSKGERQIQPREMAPLAAILGIADSQPEYLHSNEMEAARPGAAASDFTPSPTDVLAILDALEPYAQKAPETEAGRQLLASSLSSMLRFLRENPSTLGNPDDLATAARAIGSEKLSALRERQSS